MAGFWIILAIAIIAAAILFGIYIYYCAENQVKLFEPNKYGERISNLEKEIKELKEKL